MTTETTPPAPSALPSRPTATSDPASPPSTATGPAAPPPDGIPPPPPVGVGDVLVSDPEEDGPDGGRDDGAGPSGDGRRLPPRPASGTARAVADGRGSVVAPDEIPGDESPDDDGGGRDAGDEGDDESDYEYDYEDEEDNHFSGFLVTDSLSSRSDRAGDATASSVSSSAASKPTESSSAPSLFGPVGASSPASAGASSWREPSREAVNMSLRAASEKNSGRRRLASDLYRIMSSSDSSKEKGFAIEPKQEDKMTAWRIKLFQFDEDSCLAKDLEALGLDHVELEMTFPDQYPFSPPFVRVVRPRFKRQTGFVMNGALCMELLTDEGWSPVNDIESVIVSIRSLLVVGKGRLQAAVEMEEKREREARACSSSTAAASHKRRRVERDDKEKKAAAGTYTTTEAKAAYRHLSDYHQKWGWDTNGWWAKKG